MLEQARMKMFGRILFAVAVFMVLFVFFGGLALWIRCVVPVGKSKQQKEEYAIRVAVVQLNAMQTNWTILMVPRTNSTP